MTEVWRPAFNPLKPGSHYLYAEATDRVYGPSGTTPRYFTTNTLKYVGVFQSQIQIGNRQNETAHYTFDNNGKKEVIEGTYEYNTCFVEVPTPINSDIKL